MKDGSHFGITKLKVYKEEGSSFIRCHEIKSNVESIYIQQDGTIQDGIFRERLNIWFTTIGSRYFRRSGREEGRVYELYRFNNTGNIGYREKIYGKDDSDWRTLARYRFNSETLDWKKVNV